MILCYLCPGFSIPATGCCGGCMELKRYRAQLQGTLEMRRFNVMMLTRRDGPRDMEKVGRITSQLLADL